MEALNTWSTWIGGVLYTGDVPVELTSFYAVAQNTGVELKWVTATETNNYGFEISRQRVSQPNWENIGFVHGQGTTTEKQLYFFEDKNLNTGNYKYRLVQIDFDGTRNVIAETDVNINPVINSYSLLQVTRTLLILLLILVMKFLRE